MTLSTLTIRDVDKGVNDDPLGLLETIGSADIAVSAGDTSLYPTTAAVDAELARMEQAAEHRKVWWRRISVGVLTLMLAITASFGNFGVKEREADAMSGIVAGLVGAMGEVAFEAICSSDDEAMLVDCVLENIGELHVIEKCLKADDTLKCFYDAKNEKTRKEQGLEKAPDYSMYRMGSALAAFYSNGRAAQAGVEGEDESNEFLDVEGAGLGAWGGVLNKAANGGIVLGYSDPKHNEDSGWFFGQGDANNEKTYSYASLKDHQFKGPYHYATFGGLLNGLGLDGTGADDSPKDIAERKVLGYSIMAAYMLSGGIDLVFNAVISLLNTLNPFRMLVTPTARHTDETFTAGMAGGQSVENTPFQAMGEFFGTIYDWAVNIGWMVTIPVTLGLTMMGILMFRRMDKGSAVKKVVIRVVYAVVGLPLLGVTYTGALTSFLDSGASSSSTASNSTKIVLSTYVDFQSWAENTRLQVPDKVKHFLIWDTDENAPHGQSLRTVRDTALNINVASNPGLTGVSSVYAKWDDHEWMTDNATTDAATMSKESASSTFSTTIGMLDRYIDGNSLSSGSFETSIRSEMERVAAAQSGGDFGSALNPDGATVMGWVTGFNTESSLKEMDGDAVNNANNPLLEVADGAGLVGADSPSGGITFASPGTQRCDNSDVISLSGTGDFRSHCNLSPMTMYNYLNTSFAPADASVFSTSTSVSSYSRAAHSSVNIIGSGIMKVVYWFSALTLMGSFIIIGVGYAGTMLFNTIRRSLSLIGSVPFAAMGFIAAIAKVIVYTIAMFVEIVATIFLYKLVTTFLMSVPALFEAPLSNLLSTTSGQEAAAGVGMGLVGLALTASNNWQIAGMVITLVTSLGVIIFTLIAMKVRSSLVSGIDEAVTGVINRFLDTQVSSAGATSGDGMMRRAAATGAGIGATHMIMNAGSGGDDGGAGDSGSDGESGGRSGGSGSGDPDGPDGGKGGSGSKDTWGRLGAKVGAGVAATAGAGYLASKALDGAADSIIGGTTADGGDMTADGSVGGSIDGSANGADGYVDAQGAAGSVDGDVAGDADITGSGTMMASADSNAHSGYAGYSTEGGFGTSADVVSDQALADSVSESGLSQIPDTGSIAGATGTNGSDYGTQQAGYSLATAENQSVDGAVNAGGVQPSMAAGGAEAVSNGDPASGISGATGIDGGADMGAKQGKQLGELSGGMGGAVGAMTQAASAGVNSAYAAGGMGGVDVGGKMVEAAQNLSQAPGQVQDAITQYAQAGYNADSAGAGNSGGGIGSVLGGATGIAATGGIIAAGAAAMKGSAIPGVSQAATAVGGFVSGAAVNTGGGVAGHGPVAPGQPGQAAQPVYGNAENAQAYVQNNQASSQSQTSNNANSQRSTGQVMGANMAGSMAARAVQGFGQSGQMGRNVGEVMGGSGRGGGQAGGSQQRPGARKAGRSGAAQRQQKPSVAGQAMNSAMRSATMSARINSMNMNQDGQQPTQNGDDRKSSGRDDNSGKQPPAGGDNA